MQAQGHKSKSPSLEEMLKKSKTREAKLIGYDETPSCESETPKSGGLKVLQDSQSDCDVKVYRPNGRPTTKYETISRPIRELPLRRKSSDFCVTQPIHCNSCTSDSPATSLSNGSSVDPQGTGTNLRDF